MRVRYISLGEVTIPNLGKGVMALAEQTKQTPQTIQSIVQANAKIIGQFKLGEITEDQFDKLFIAEFEKTDGVKVAIDELNSAWAKMNPAYADFKGRLESVLAFNKKDGQKVVFVSDSNPKDIRQLCSELEKNKVSYRLDSNNNLCEIDGIEVHLSYVLKMTKENFLAEKLKAEEKSDDDIKCITPDPKLNERLVNQAIFWDKKKASFEEILNSGQSLKLEQVSEVRKTDMSVSISSSSSVMFHNSSVPAAVGAGPSQSTADTLRATK